jgi:hypothetical protein
MPETAVYKDSNTFAMEDEVWFADQRLMTPPSCDTVLSQESCQRNFCLLVAL